MSLATCSRCRSTLPAGVPRCPSCGQPVPTTDVANVGMAALPPNASGGAEPADSDPHGRRTVAVKSVESGEAEQDSPSAGRVDQTSHPNNPLLSPWFDPAAPTDSAPDESGYASGSYPSSGSVYEGPLEQHPPPSGHSTVLDSDPAHGSWSTSGYGSGEYPAQEGVADQGSSSGQNWLPDSGSDANMLAAEASRGHTRRPNLATTMALELGKPGLDETAIEGLEPVEPRKHRGVVEVDPGRRHALRRAAPLIAVLLVGALGLAAASYVVVTNESAASAEDPDAGLRVVSLPSATIELGLTDDNKEAVLATCFRISDNPNYECRRSYLEDLGEYPSREVTMPELRIDAYEVTNVRYQACVEDGGCTARDLDACQFHTHRGYQLNAELPDRLLSEDLPAGCVTRSEAAAFCEWAGGRLPTPDEWERAARGGDDRLNPWGELWAPGLMNWAETDMGGFHVVGRLDGYDLTAPVTSFEDGATPDGIFNVFGNVAEWVEPGPDDPNAPVGTRGASYCDDLREFRMTMLRPLRAEARRSDVGFRCVYTD